MKKFIITSIVTFMATIAAFAQKDTCIVSSTNKITFETEVTTSKTGNVKTNYLVKCNGEYYLTDKTSYTRYQTAKRFGVKPNIAVVYDEKTKSKKFIVL